MNEKEKQNKEPITLKINKEEKLDGYYAIVTSEMDKSDDEIIDIINLIKNIRLFFISKKCQTQAISFLSKK